jgi:putative component of toxin-antitoxin plasmid stabilization module
LKVLKCDAGEGWSRSVGPIVREMKKRQGEEYRTYSKRRMDHILCRNCILEHVIQRKIKRRIERREDEEEDVSSYWMIFK